MITINVIDDKICGSYGDKAFTVEYSKELYERMQQLSHKAQDVSTVEEYNEVIRQLLSSEDIWIVEDNKTIPILVKDSNFTYRTHLNDKLVNYTIEFEYAFSGINTIR